MRKIHQAMQEYSIPLIVGIVAALIWANLSPETYEHFVHFPIFGEVTIHFLVEDVFMVFFFATAAVEIVESLLPGGSLNPIKRAFNPLIATVGGVAGPVIVYLGLNALIGQPEYTVGWGIPTATDIAIAWLVAKLVFGEGHPAIKYLLLLAIADDAIGLVIIAIFYPSGAVLPQFLILCLLGMSVALTLRKMHVNGYIWYLVLGGIPCWLGLHFANIHASLALVLIVPFLPAVPEDVTDIDDEDDERAMEKFNRQWKPVVDYGLFFFGLCNAGVAFSNINSLTLVILGALILGKCGGIFLFGYIADKIGCSLPKGMGHRDLLVAGLVAGIGLTVALFMCNSAFSDPMLQGAAKMGALLSILSGGIAFAVSRLVGVQRYKAGEMLRPIHTHLK
ncbi:MAG: Na+/H+ antiporter NhaA [Bacillota bacterium]|nr:Na+/H+ antiporter NhaA [Bacillota bacterium]